MQTTTWLLFELFCSPKLVFTQLRGLAESIWNQGIFFRQVTLQYWPQKVSVSPLKRESRKLPAMTLLMFLHLYQAGSHLPRQQLSLVKSLCIAHEPIAVRTQIFVCVHKPWNSVKQIRQCHLALRTQCWSSTICCLNGVSNRSCLFSRRCTTVQCYTTSRDL